MDDMKKTNRLPMPVSKERKEATNAKTRRALFEAHAALGEQITEQRRLPVTKERAQLLESLGGIVSTIENVYRSSKSLDDETPLDGATEDAA